MSSYITPPELRLLIPNDAAGLDRMDLEFIIEGWKGEVAQANGGQEDLGALARSVVRRGAIAETMGEILRLSGHLAGDETTSMEDSAEKKLTRYAAAKKAERDQKKAEESSRVTSVAYISTWPPR